MPDDRRLRRGIGGLADLPVLGGDRSGVDDRPALAVLEPVERHHAGRRLGDARKVPTRLTWIVFMEQVDRQVLIAPVSRSRLTVLTALPVPAQ